MKVDNIFLIMSQRNITAKELSKKTGISAGNISDWKSGRSSPKAEALIKIADYFGVSVDYILGRGEISTEINSRNNVTGNYNVIGNNSQISVKGELSAQEQ